NIWDAAAKFATLLASIAVVYTQWGIVGVILASAGAATVVRLINCIALFGHEKRFLLPSTRMFDWNLLRALLSEGGALLLLQMSAIAIFQTDKLIIGLVLKPADVT